MLSATARAYYQALITSTIGIMACRLEALDTNGIRLFRHGYLDLLWARRRPTTQEQEHWRGTLFSRINVSTRQSIEGRRERHPICLSYLKLSYSSLPLFFLHEYQHEFTPSWIVSIGNLEALFLYTQNRLHHNESVENNSRAARTKKPITIHRVIVRVRRFRKLRIITEK